MPSVADPRRFQCSLCHIHIPNCKEDWLRHLIEKPHRRKAMKEFIEWSDQERRNSLLIFSNFPLMECTSLRGRTEEKVSAGAVTFLQKFIFRAGVVTRFLCWADKPNVAVVKFEEYWTMRNKLCEVMVETRWPENNKTVKISLDNQDQYFVQAGFMSLYSKLEVLAILPSEAYKPPPVNDVIQLPVQCFNKKPTDPLIDDDDSLFIIEEPVERQQRQEIPIVELDVTESSFGFAAQGSRRTYQAQAPPPPVAEKTNLQIQYEAVMKAVEIPQNKYDHYLDLIDSLQKFAGGVDPQVKVQGIRNYYLKLKNNASGNDDKVLVLLYKTGFYSERDLLTTILSAMKKDFYSKFCDTDTFSFLPHETGSQDVHSPGEKVTFFSNRRPRLRFHLITAKSFIAEAQVNSLLLYLCTFDPRCRPLIALARYWAQVNPGTFPESTSSVNLANCHRKLVQPNGLDWMVIYFMECWGCIPKPAEIQSRAHLTLFDLETGTDIGFNSDPAFMTEWKAKRRDVLEERIASDQSIISVLTLFKYFLREYNRKESLSIHLQTRDGYRITSGNELRGRQMILSHPFVPNWEFDFPGNLWPTFRIMGNSCYRLEAFLNSHSIRGSESLNLYQIMKAAK